MDREYFHSFDDYKKTEVMQPIALKSNGYAEVKLEFYQMSFSNNAVAYLFETIEKAKNFMKYFNLPANRTPYVGEIKGIEERTVFECLKRKPSDFESLCEQLAEDKKYCVIYAPFAMSWQKGKEEADELGALMAKYGGNK